MPPEPTTLPGQATLLANWDALTHLSPGAYLDRTPVAAASVFPSWAPLNNAILLHNPTDTGNGATLAEVRRLQAVYSAAGVHEWALWLPSDARDLDAPGAGRGIAGLARDTTTLVMRATISSTSRRHDAVVETSVASAARAGDDPVPLVELEQPQGPPGLKAWVLVQDGAAVVGAWSYLHDGDCGIYGVETVPRWRRRGLASALVGHVLADARADGARTTSLQSTRMGQPLYTSLGFTAVGRYEEWISTQGPNPAAGQGCPA